MGFKRSLTASSGGSTEAATFRRGTRGSFGDAAKRPQRFGREGSSSSTEAAASQPIAEWTRRTSQTSQKSEAVERRPSVASVRHSFNQSTYAPLLVEHAMVDEGDLEMLAMDSWLMARKPGLFRAFLSEFVKQNVQVVTANGWPPEAETVAEATKALAAEVRSATVVTWDPSWLFIACSDNLPPDEVLDAVLEQFPGTRNIHCVTSCKGVTTDTGFKNQISDDGDHWALSILAVYDPLGTYVTIGLPTPKEALDVDFVFAMDQAYLRLREEAPALMKHPENDGLSVPTGEPLADNLHIWISGLPGTEEKALEALYEWSHSRFNRTVPVLGGTAADASIGGKWSSYCQQWDGQRRYFSEVAGGGLVLTLLVASVKVYPCFMHPFTPMQECTAQVVECGTVAEDKESQGRVVHTLRDAAGREWPAGTLYHQWCEDQIQKKLMPPPEMADGPNSFNKAVLAASTACPLGVQVAREGDEAYDYRMMHPSGIYYHEQGKSGAYLKNFASVDKGNEIVLFKIARRGDLLHRLAKLKEQLVQQIDRANAGADIGASNEAMRGHICGALMVYCAGCMMALQASKDGKEQMRRLTASLSKCFAGRPFMAYHPFGEQGFFPSKQVNHHSNLMFSALVFSKDPCIEADEGASFVDLILPIVKMFTGCDERQVAYQVLSTLLARGHKADFDGIAGIVRGSVVTPALLQDITPCAAKPLLFALHCARMFHTMAERFPLKAREYRRSEAWFKDFCTGFMESSTLSLLAKGNVLDLETIRLAVLMAVEIDNKGLVASNSFQELLHEIWSVSVNVDEAMRRLLADDGSMPRGCSSWTPSPKVRHYVNVTSYIIVTLLQMYASGHDQQNLFLWIVVATWTGAHSLQTWASPPTGRFSYLTTLDDAVLLIAHLLIVRSVAKWGEVPRDLDALSMLMHFSNLTTGLVVHPKLGPLIIMVTTMIADMKQLLVLVLFFLAALHSTFNALFRDVVGDFVGEKWTSPSVLLVNAVWGPQVLWSSSHDHSEQTLFLSAAAGIADSSALDLVGAALISLTVFAVPILLLNLLIALMASSYQTVLSDVDSEYKRSFAACVLVARELPLMPIPFSLPFDAARCMAKFLALFWHRKETGRPGGVCGNLAASAGCCVDGSKALLGRREGTTSEDLEESAEQLAVSQLVQAWEASRMLKKYQETATREQIERLRVQGDGVTDRVNLVFNMVWNVHERIELLEGRTKAMPSNGARDGRSGFASRSMYASRIES